MIKNSECVLIADTGNHGGVATYLDSFLAFTDKAGIRIINAFFIHNSPTKHSEYGGKHTYLIKNYRSWLHPYLSSLVDNIASFIWFGCLRLWRIRCETLIIQSHSPYRFYIYALLFRHTYYYLHVVPDARVSRLNYQVVSLLVRLGRISFCTDSIAAAKAWASSLSLPPGQITAIYNPSLLSCTFPAVFNTKSGNEDICSEKSCIPPYKRIVLTVGVLESFKDPSTWYKLAKIATKANPNLAFVWVGNGSLYSKYRELAAGSDDIFFLGYHSQASLVEIYREAWVYFHTSLKEAGGISIIDALAFSLPVILNAREAQNDILQSRRAGYNIDFSKANATEELLGVLDALEEERHYKEMAVEARELYESSYAHSAWTASQESFLGIT